MNLILEKTDQVPYFTNMRLVFRALGLSADAYDWYVSDIETNYYGSEFSSEDQWLSGETLRDFLEKNEVQFIWALFSAVPKELRTAVEVAPYIEENPNYWSGEEISPQLNGALFEIACWDSSATILVGLPPEAESLFVRAYPDTRSLVSVAR
jgi:hypothetical protein